MKRIRFILYFILIGINFSCIRKELPVCPPLQVNITVKDKNYFNVTENSEWQIDEKLPFRNYVETLYYLVRNIDDGSIIKEQKTVKVQGDTDDFRLEIPDNLPFGKYEITVWGNIHTEMPPENGLTELHPDGKNGNDVYVSVDTLFYEPNSSFHTLQLERTKGKLVVLVENLSSNASLLTSSLNNIYRYVDKNHNYMGCVEVTNSNILSLGSSFVIEGIYSPTLDGKYSIFNIGMLVSEGKKEVSLYPDEVHFKMYRNTLTMLKYVYHPIKNDFTVYTMVDNVWQEINDMEVE